MKNNYVIDKVPFDKLDVQSRSEYGKVWYCHLIGYPNILVGGSIGSKKHAQMVCDIRNLKFHSRLNDQMK
jgi:hypothetical protein